MLIWLKLAISLKSVNQANIDHLMEVRELVKSVIPPAI